VHERALVAGKYRILEKIGEGGMGSVWLAKNEVTERDFAIKFLHAGAGTKESQLARFFGEAKVAGRLRHPSIVEIFDAGTEPTLDNTPYLVMEALDGVGLDEAIRRAGGLPLGVSLEILAAVASGLSLAHAKGIIHRDLKASNVFLHRVGTGALVAKVLDFGISKVLVDETTGQHVSSGMTRTGAILGSPLYMSPEQAAGDKSIDARSDVHSLGVMLWECLTGLPPFQADTYGLLLVEIIQGERRSLDSVLPTVPPSVAALVSKAIARDRTQRFADAGEMATALEDQLHELGHQRELSGRTGADDFMKKLGGPERQRAETASSTTAAVSVPSPAVPAKSAHFEEPALPAQPLDTSVSLPLEGSSRSGLGIVAAAVAVVFIVGGVFYFRSRPTTPPVAEETSPTPPAAATAENTANPTALQPIEPEVTPTASQAPSATPPARVAAPVVIAKKKPVVAPAGEKPKDDPGKSPTGGKEKPPPVHHGVTSSGL
jgi:serine/threonine protein kinase